MEVNTHPSEFKRFHYLLTKDHPDYEPFYFPLERNGKDPLKNKSWKKNRKTYEEAYKLMEKGFNIGIAGTDKDQLVIIDVDDISQVGEIKPTLINQSRKRIGRHGFYFTEDSIAKSIFDNSAKQNIATEDAGEVRSNWQYVVAPGSYVPCAPEEVERIPECDRENAGYYSIMVEHSVSSLTYDEIPEAYRTCLENKRASDTAAHQRKDKRSTPKVTDHKNKSALWDLTISEVTGKSEHPTNRFPSLFHGSKTYKDTSVSNGMLHCWRHNVSHTALTTLAVLAGVSTCSTAGYGHNGSGVSAVNFDDGEVIYKLWRYAKDHGFIPDSDPMPTKAMVYYAVDNTLCHQKDVIGGWKLPPDVYNRVLETTEFNVGREPLKKKIGQAISGAVNNSMQIAQALQEEVPIYYDVSKNYWMWNHDGERYERIDETEILCQIMQGMGMDSIYRSRTKAEIMESIRITGRMRRVQQTPRTWIQFDNCVVDIDSDERFQATPDYFFAARIPHRYGTSEDTPTIDQLFENWVGPERKQLLYEICAYCMYDHYPIHRIFTLIGPGGNGKGQLMELIRRFIGADNYTSTDLDRLSKSQFETSKLFKKKAAFVGETNFNTLSRTNMLKQLSGGDIISCEFKGKDSFDFVNTAKIIIATNALPATTDRTRGFYRRWLIVEFNNSFPEGKDVIDDIPEEEYENLCRKCIRILNDLLESGSFTAEGTIEERAALYERKSNPVNAFIDENCVKDEGASMPTWYLFDRYEEFRERGGFRELSKRDFTKIVHELGYETSSTSFSKEQQAKYKKDPSADRKTWRIIKGLDIREADDDEEVTLSYTNYGTSTSISPREKQSKDSVTSVTSVTSGEISPNAILDNLIISEVKQTYETMHVPDINEFVLNFCNKYAMFKGSIVGQRVEELALAGFSGGIQ
ncbi:phage/plasmid primase, P4 family [Methanococcoides sp. AM1]|uniref:phage/plasmid primase, P4 family n=1 Tax=Methanococcoides sp. AM1 TaxID=1201011 RepID=UPI0010823B31|nr:phage/plasmid primase, P4 family [Methanococcoides sp. AM1]